MPVSNDLAQLAVGLVRDGQDDVDDANGPREARNLGLVLARGWTPSSIGR